MTRPQDVVVIGAGIVGLATAYALTRAAPGLAITVLEKEDGPAHHQTGHNSGVIHSGIYYRPGSLKAQYALTGSVETPKFCADHGIPHAITGKLIVATAHPELPRLHALAQRGRDHGLTIRELGPAQIAAAEPAISGLAALHVASTGVCDFPAIATTLARLITDAGCEIRYGARVTAITQEDPERLITVRTGSGTGSGRGGFRSGGSRGAGSPGDGSPGAGSPGDGSPGAGSPGGGSGKHGLRTEGSPGAGSRSAGPGTSGPRTSGPGGTDLGPTDLRTKVLINCAGLHSDRVARLAGHDPGMRIIPFRGEFYELAPARRDLVRGLVYPVPDPDFPFLGVHLTRDIHGAVHLGPNAVPALAREGYRRRTIRLRDLADTAAFPGTWHIARRHWRQETAEIRRSLSKRAFTTAARRLLPSLRPEDLIPAPAGVRAQAVLPDGTLVDDFLFAGSAPFVHVLNAPSPAATAAFPIGREVARRALEAL